MKRFLSIFIFGSLLFSACGSDFLDDMPKGRYHEGNYDMQSAQELLVISKLFEGYNAFKEQTWPVTAMHCHTSDNSHPGGPAGDGGTDFCQFPTLSFTSANSHIASYYSGQYTAITKANEALEMIGQMDGQEHDEATINQLKAEAVFIRAAAYFRLTQAFGAVPYVDHVMDKEDEMADQLPAAEIRRRYSEELVPLIDCLPTRQEMVASGNLGRATQNAARAILAKTCLYEKNYTGCLQYVEQIIASKDNDLTTPYADIWLEKNEFGPESVWEINADFAPDLNIDMWCQWNMMNGIRGYPNLGWGHNAPSEDLMADYEEGDPRYAATVLEDGQSVDGETIKASDYRFFNKKAYCPLSERSLYGRADWCFGYWANLRIIRYADIILMGAESACELGQLERARELLEMVRSRARGENSPLTCLPVVRTDDLQTLRDAIRHERRIELALEFERYFDLVRWGIAEDKLPDFVVGKHELFPLPQSEIDKSNGKLQQNAGY